MKVACFEKIHKYSQIQLWLWVNMCLNYFLPHFPVSAYQDFNLIDLPIKLT